MTDSLGRIAVESMAGPCLALLCACLTATANAGEGDSLLRRIADSYGIKELPASIRHVGRTHSIRRGEGPMERLWHGPNRFRITLDYPGGTEVRELDGARAWRSGRPMSGPFRQAMQLQAARSALPWSLLARGARVSHLGGGMIDGRRTELLILPLEGDLRLIVEVEAESARIVRSTGAGIGALQFITEYGDFRRQGDQLFAQTERHFAMGRYIGFSTIESLHFSASRQGQNHAPGNTEPD